MKRTSTTASIARGRNQRGNVRRQPKRPGLCWFDLDWIVVVLKRERQRMKKSVIAFNDPFAVRVMR